MVFALLPKIKAMNKTIFILFVFFAFLACKKTEPQAFQTKSEYVKPEQFRIDSIKINDSVRINDFLSVQYTSKLLVFPDIKDKVLLDSIYFQNKDFTDFSKQGLQSSLEKEKNTYFNSVKDSNKEWLSDINRKQTWNSNSSMDVKSNINDFLQIQYIFSSYEGGAHDNYGFSERVFDLKNKKKLALKDITTMPQARLEALLKRNIDMLPSGTTDSQGAVKNSDMLLVDVIPATENFYFDEKNLYFHYSPYKIAAFAAGDIVIPVSWEDLKTTLTPQFRERMKNFQ